MSNRDLAAQIAANFAANADDSEEVLRLLRQSYDTLQSMEGEAPVETAATAGQPAETGPEPVMDPQKAIGKDAINCLVCGKGFKTLTRHIKQAHGMTPKEYREAFGLGKDYPLVAKSLSQQRRKVAKDRGLGERMAEARRQQREES